ncbi:hypothetical protein HDV04_001747 [Boothiomyces sp. JEL0838]|nr:hypothetical protein HDV04_001747 [Boothiomyces sp. JEL0838]
MSKCNVQDGDMETLISHLHESQLEELFLEKNELTDITVERLFGKISKSKLHTIDLSRNRATLSPLIELNDAIENLIMDNFRITLHDLYQFLETLSLEVIAINVAAYSLGYIVDFTKSVEKINVRVSVDRLQEFLDRVPKNTKVHFTGNNGVRYLE